MLTSELTRKAFKFLRPATTLCSSSHPACGSKLVDSAYLYYRAGRHRDSGDQPPEIAVLIPFLARRCKWAGARASGRLLSVPLSHGHRAARNIGGRTWAMDEGGVESSGLRLVTSLTWQPPSSAASSCTSSCTSLGAETSQGECWTQSGVEDAGASTRSREGFTAVPARQCNDQAW